MSNTAWDLEALRNHVCSNVADPALLLEVIRSIDRSTRIFEYHLFMARDALKGTFNEHDPAGAENFIVLLGGSEDPSRLEKARVASEAHITSCFQTARSLLDIFSHLLNGLILGSVLPIHRCDLLKSALALPESQLKGHVESVIATHWFNYLSAFTNVTKHRQLIGHSVSISFVENKVGVRIEAFVYNGTAFPSYWAQEALAGVLTVKNSVVALGRSLNAACVLNHTEN
jgi:hypothetical protein